jgi:hypothetical protein
MVTRIKHGIANHHWFLLRIPLVLTSKGLLLISCSWRIDIKYALLHFSRLDIVTNKVPIRRHGCCVSLSRWIPNSDASLIGIVTGNTRLAVFL